MSKGLFITGTGTDTGKTYITALIVKKLRENGYNAGYYKAALSGAEIKNDTFIPGDAEYVSRISGLNDPYHEIVSYTYKNAVSPHLAARMEGDPVVLDKVLKDYDSICRKHEYMTVEGSGGIVCPIRYDNDNSIFLTDIIKALDLNSLIVADAGLGTINATVLTVEYMKNRSLPVKGIILNNWENGNIMHEDNKNMIEQLTGISVVATVAKDDENIFVSAENLACMYE